MDPREAVTCCGVSAQLTAITGVLLMLLAASLANAAENPDRPDIRAAQERVEIARQEAQSARAVLNKNQKRLRDAEKAVGAAASELSKIRARARQLGAGLASVKARRDALAAQTAKQRAAIEADVRRSWQLGRQQQLRLWLNADDPLTVARTLRYFDYFQRGRSERITQYGNTQAELSGIEEKLVAEQAQLDSARQELEKREGELRGARDERKQAIASLAADLRAKERTLAESKADAAALQKLFGEARQAFRDVPPESVGAPLAQRKGKLRWPVIGRLAAKFGALIEDGKMTLNGIVIAANPGSDVRAVQAGRVVFADWLRGYGQLVILDHGSGYLTAYGYNESLTRQVGDWVGEGDTVATVGSSGGRSSAGLYFELRKDGEPQDPARWLRR